MSEKPSNTREQCAYDSGASKARILLHAGHFGTSTPASARDARNPHKNGTKEHKFWTDGFDGAIDNATRDA